MNLWLGLMIPFFGTALGSACVLFMKKNMSPLLHRSLSGFAAGVMVAASVWSLLIPAMNYASDMGKLAFLPSAIGFLLGIGFLLTLDRLVPHLHCDGEAEGLPCSLPKSTMLVFAVALHNIPEGMAVGIVYAGVVSGSSELSIAGALALSIGIAIQNFPEGAIISMPLKAEGVSKGKSFALGIVSGIVEPIAAILTVLAADLILPLLPYLLSFAAGAMLYVVVEELIPESAQGKHSNIGTIAFSIGFCLMMILDVSLG